MILELLCKMLLFTEFCNLIVQQGDQNDKNQFLILLLPNVSISVQKNQNNK